MDYKVGQEVEIELINGTKYKGVIIEIDNGTLYIQCEDGTIRITSS